jgi:hypothetical protein
MTPKQLKQLLERIKPATDRRLKDALRHLQRAKLNGRATFNFERWLSEYEAGRERA